ncbi:MAG: cytochrome c-type biogenesis protein CcmH [Acidobacteria bacterium]|nr:cytochrome c-type biogenesis protein CcmH [Acidobacteriota bacterium]MBV9925272.1 cytochrome c-type biogenesis protein CcmH [Acidobacteriota bacterium]
MIVFVFLALLQLKVPDAQQLVGAPAGKKLAGAELDQKTMELSQILRCPVCQGLSISDSPSIMAANMRDQVRDLLVQGYSQEQVLKYFEQSYGQFVLLKPKFQGVNTFVWLLPLGALLIGLAITLVKMNKLDAAPAAPAPEAPADDPYVARVRELVEK